MNDRVAALADPYPTRTNAEPLLIDRVDPVVWGDAAGPLEPELVTSFNERGFLVLPSWLPRHEVAVIDEALGRLAVDDDIKRRARAIVEPDSDTLRSLFEIHRGEGPTAAITRDERLVGVARQLLGSEVYLHQSRANLKPGLRGREFYWHSDFETWHAEDGMPSMRAISCSVSMTTNHSWNGPLLCIPGSHRTFVSCVGATPAANHERSLRAQHVGVPDDASLIELVDRGGIEACTGPPGTVIFFDSNLMHGSNGNITPHARRNLFLVYNSVDNALVEPFAAEARRPTYLAARTFTPV